MKIKRFIFRQQQTSILNEEISEILAIFEVEFPDPLLSGIVALEVTYHKRDVEHELYVSENLLLPFKKGEDLFIQLDEAMWSMTPETDMNCATTQNNLRKGLKRVT